MVHIGRPHTSLPYRGGGTPIVLDPDLVDIGELEASPSTILGVNENNEWTLNPINGGWLVLLNSDDTSFIMNSLGGMFIGDVDQAVDGLKTFVKKLSVNDGIGMNSSKVTDLAPGTAGTDAVNKNQLDGKQAASAKIDALLTAIAPGAGSTVRVPLFTNSGDAWNYINTSPYGRGLFNLTAAADLRVTAGLQIGTDVQAYSADLAGIAAAAIGNSRVPVKNAAGTWTSTPYGTFGLAMLGALDAATANNLLPTAINAQTGTNRGPGLTDAQKLITMNNANPNTITIPATATVAFPEGTVLGGMQIGTGQTSFVAASGVTLRAPMGAKIARQYGMAAVIKVGADEWVAYGDVTT